MLIITLICSSELYCQSAAKVYPDPASYMAGEHLSEDVTIEVHNDMGTYGDIDYDIHIPYNIRAPRKRKRMVSNAWAIEHNNILLINCSTIRYKWFVPVLYRNDRFLYFRGFMSRLPEHGLQMHRAGRQTINRVNNSRNAAGIIALGGVGALAASNVPGNVEMRSDRYNYLYDLHTLSVLVIDIPQMQELLTDHPRLQQEYMKQGHPEDPNSIIYFLKAME